MTGSSTITVKDTTGFSSSGTLQIDSEQFTYTGKTATTFTGVLEQLIAQRCGSLSKWRCYSNSCIRKLDSKRYRKNNAGKYKFERFNFDGNNKIIVVDGVNDPTVFNTSLQLQMLQNQV